jgi:hypothetical protein
MGNLLRLSSVRKAHPHQHRPPNPAEGGSYVLSPAGDRWIREPNQDTTDDQTESDPAPAGED